ncbi:motility protein A [Azospirillum thermophilum]|uniref:Flagellar motor protein MotA n=1 Tax=Azospirillum thermophilum TaxID=2202148 RepID=A0A2S2CWL2_9PROT|nr:MotA/TolQ/ExbB proton channel family protein [Azospirillum thermophilum]AWK88914.1 flagellar motor protein MotA [Azospirillum thermophilum]
MTATRDTAETTRPRAAARQAAASAAAPAAVPAPTAPARSLRLRGGLDVATLVGLAAAAAVIGLAMGSGGSLRSFIDPPSLMIVLGGTLAVTTASFSLGDVAVAWKDAAAVLIHQTLDPKGVARQVLLLAEAARRSPETLRNLLPELRSEPFLYRSITLVTEGLPPDVMERMLAGEVEASGGARAKSAGVLRRASEVAPAMGLIGTLVGLVQMMGSLNDPSAIGPAMALALLTTFYGAVLGNVVLAPLAAKVERAAEDDALVKTLYTIGAVSIARQENPRRLEMLLNAVLPPGKRIQYFDREAPKVGA